MNPPVLYVFAISHYCEKARWALDAVGIAYTLRHLAPGPHAALAKELGAPGTSLPLLVTEAGLVHGSGAILDWADANAPDPSKRLNPDPDHADACREIEQRLDDVAGVHGRRYFYSEAMVEHPDTLRPIFTRDLEPAEREAIAAGWGRVRELMIAAMDLGREQQQLDLEDAP